MVPLSQNPWQPVRSICTWPRPLRPSSSTKASYTLSLREAWQPVPEQMVTQGLFGSSAARS